MFHAGRKTRKRGANLPRVLGRRGLRKHLFYGRRRVEDRRAELQRLLLRSLRSGLGQGQARVRGANIFCDVPAGPARAGRTHHKANQYLAGDKRAALPLPASRDGETDSVSAATEPSDKNSKGISL